MNELLCFVTVVFSSLPILSLTEAKTGGFSIELIHRDSPQSPFHNRSITPAEVLTNAALRSIHRLNHFRLSSTDEKAIESMVISNGGDYLMKLSIGTPPVEFYAVADTGSDLIWIQCMPCVCYPQDSPLFDPAKSSTYQGLSCVSIPCTELPRYRCGNTSECVYSYSYGDQSYTQGDLTTDTFTFSSTNNQAVSFPKSVFGCGRNNDGQFTGREAGIVGLGGGPLSLVSQLGADIEHKFSYCLVPLSASSTSKLRFGMEAIISGNGTVSTPLVPKYPDTFYYLTLQGISIGDKTVPVTLGELGNIVIDSGTTLTILESSFYDNLEALVKEAIPLEPVQAPDPFNLCYANASGDGFPDMIFHFMGADLRLIPFNTFVGIDDRVCLSIVPTDRRLSIFGNLAQVNFQVEYNLEGKQVSFAPADCSN